MNNVEALTKFFDVSVYAHSVLSSVTSKQLEELKRLAKYETPEMLRRKVEAWKDQDVQPVLPGMPPKEEPKKLWQPCQHYKAQPWFSGEGSRKCPTCEREAAEQKQFEAFASATGSKQLATVARGRKIVEELHATHGSFVERWTRKQAKKYFKGHVNRDFLKDIVAKVWVKVIETVDGYTETGIEAASAKWLMKIIHSVVNDHAKYLFAKMRDVRQTVEWNEATENRRARGNSGPVSKPTSFGHSSGASPKIDKGDIGKDGENGKHELWDQRQSAKDWGTSDNRLISRARAGEGWVEPDMDAIAKVLEQHSRARERLSRMIARHKALEAVVATATAVGVVGVQAGTGTMEGAA